MRKVNSMYTILLYWFFITNVICNPDNVNKSRNSNPFWINSCGYKINNTEDYDDSDADKIDRIITLVNQCQSTINSFKYQYIQQTFKISYDEHYNRWINENNSWITSRLLEKAEDNMTQSSLNPRSFPRELKFSYEVLQRVSVGFEILLDDASKNDSLENKFNKKFTTCKSDLQQLLCEISDNIDDKLPERPKDITRNEVPDEVLEETNTAKRNLTNSITFRDYMIAIKYMLNTYDYLKSKCNNNNWYPVKSRNSKTHFSDYLFIYFIPDM